MTLLLLDRRKISTVVDFNVLAEIKNETVDLITEEYRKCDNVIRYYFKY